MIETSTALNVCQYLLIKAEHAQLSGQANDNEDEDSDNIVIDNQDEDNIKNHPVIQRLNELNHLKDKLHSDVESKVKGLHDQVENLVKASSLMFGNDEGDDEESPSDSDGSVEINDNISMNSEKQNVLEDDDLDEGAIEANSGSESSSDDDEDDEEEDTAQIQRNIMNEARFALRSQDDIDINGDEDQPSSKRRRRIAPINSDYGDEDDANEAELNKAARSLASTVNTISQRNKKAPKQTISAEIEDDANEERFLKGLDMMEEDIGVDSDDDRDIDMDDNELDDGLDDDDFYSQIKKKSKEKKEFKKNLYAVAPKYPGMDDEIEGEREVGRMIMKNRGLVAHKAKINRNPRVKKREQYRKAIIRRKGTVREVRTDEGHKYGGEQTGIKSGLSRSRKL